MYAGKTKERLDLYPSLESEWLIAHTNGTVLFIGSASHYIEAGKDITRLLPFSLRLA